jgi:glycosyltransferase involved in cell wall biosynthesis
MNNISIILGHKPGGILSVYNSLIDDLNSAHDIQIITFDYTFSDNSFFPNNSKFNLGISPKLTGFNAIRFIIKIIKRSKLGHNNYVVNNLPTSFLLYFSSFFTRLKFIVHIHEPIFSNLNNKSFLYKCIFKYLLKKVLVRSISTIVVSNKIQSEIYNFLKLDSLLIENPLPIKLINNIVNENNPFNSSFINLLTVGRFTEAKGFLELVKNFTKVVQNNPTNLKLYLIGDGEKFDMINDFVQSNNMSENVILLGFIKDPFNYIAHCDYYISSSKWEGFGLTILYAMYLKRKILSTPTFGAKELLKNGINFYNSDDEFVSFFENLDSDSKFEPTIKNNYNRSLEFNLDIIAERFIIQFDKFYE